MTGRSACTASLRKEAGCIGVLVGTGVERPAAELAVPCEPDTGELPNVSDDLIEHRDDHWPAAEMTMQGEHQHAHRLVLVEIVEGPCIDVDEIAGARPQDAIVGEIAVGHCGNDAVLRLDAVWQV